MAEGNDNNIRAAMEEVVVNEVHHHYYHGQVVHGDIVGSKTEVKDSYIDHITAGSEEKVEPQHTEPEVNENRSVNCTEQESLLRLIKAYRDEEANIPVTTREKYKDVFPLIQHVWRRVKTQAIARSSERELAETSDNIAGNPMLPEYHELATNYLAEMKITSHLTPYMEKLPTVIKLAKEMKTHKKHVTALILQYTVAKLNNLSNFGEPSVRSISHFVYEMKLSVDDIVKEEVMKPAVLQHILPLMCELMEDLKSAERSCKAVRIEFEGWCLCNIALCHGACGDNAKYAFLNDYAVELLEMVFQERAPKYAMYKICLQNAGEAYERLGDQPAAFARYKKAQDAE